MPPKPKGKKPKVKRNSTMQATAKDALNYFKSPALKETTSTQFIERKVETMSAAGLITVKKSPQKTPMKRTSTMNQTATEGKQFLSGKKAGKAKSPAKKKAAGAKKKAAAGKKPAMKRAGTMQKTAAEGKKFLGRGKGKKGSKKK